jgi:hypothetical protein
MKNENLEVKIKFFELEQNDDEEEDEEEEKQDDYEFDKRLRMRLIKKKGEISAWYEIFNKMRDTVFADLLLAPETHVGETLETMDSD